LRAVPDQAGTIACRRRSDAGLEPSRVDMKQCDDWRLTEGIESVDSRRSLSLGVRGDPSREGAVPGSPAAIPLWRIATPQRFSAEAGVFAPPPPP
jgi:hypothetical protein